MPPRGRAKAKVAPAPMDDFAGDGTRLGGKSVTPQNIFSFAKKNGSMHKMIMKKNVMTGTRSPSGRPRDPIWRAFTREDPPSWTRFGLFSRV